MLVILGQGSGRHLLSSGLTLPCCPDNASSRDFFTDAGRVPYSFLSAQDTKVLNQTWALPLKCCQPSGDADTRRVPHPSTQSRGTLDLCQDCGMCTSLSNGLPAEHRVLDLCCPCPPSPSTTHHPCVFQLPRDLGDLQWSFLITRGFPPLNGLQTVIPTQLSSSLYIKHDLMDNQVTIIQSEIIYLGN